MKSNPEHRDILTECNQRMADLVEGGPPPAWPPWEVEDYEMQIEHGPRYACGAWFNYQTEAERMRYRRAIDELVRDGLLTTWKQYGRKLSHVKLTDTGKRAARKLASLCESCDK